MRRARDLIWLGAVVALVALLALLAHRPGAPGHPAVADCERNLQQLAVALEAYAADNGGKVPAIHIYNGPPVVFADRLQSALVPRYLKSIPTCPAAGADTYSLGYRPLVTNRPSFKLACRGNAHAAEGLPADAPSLDTRHGPSRTATADQRVELPGAAQLPPDLTVVSSFARKPPLPLPGMSVAEARTCGVTLSEQQKDPLGPWWFDGATVFVDAACKSVLSVEGNSLQSQGKEILDIRATPAEVQRVLGTPSRIEQPPRGQPSFEYATPRLTLTVRFKPSTYVLSLPAAPPR